MDFIDIAVYSFGCNTQQCIYMRFAIHSFLSSSDFSTRDSIAISVSITRQFDIATAICGIGADCWCKNTRKPNQTSDSKNWNERERESSKMSLCLCMTIACQRWIKHSHYSWVCAHSNAATQRLWGAVKMRYEMATTTIQDPTLPLTYIIIMAKSWS